MKNFEMADATNPEDVIMATQRSLVEGLRGLFKDLSKDIKQPGLTWEQIDLTLVKFGEKKPEIIVQRGEM